MCTQCHYKIMTGITKLDEDVDVYGDFLDWTKMLMYTADGEELDECDRENFESSGDGYTGVAMIFKNFKSKKEIIKK